MNIKKLKWIIPIALLAALLVGLALYLPTRPMVYKEDGAILFIDRFTGTVDTAYIDQNGYTFPEEVSGVKLTQIGANAVLFTDVKSIHIPAGVTSIGDQAFASCRYLSRIEIPKTVQSIGFAPFCDCSSLKKIAVEPDNPGYCSEDGVLFNRDKTELIQFPAAQTGAYQVPDSVTHIGRRSFWGCGLNSVVLPAHLTSIGSEVFTNCRGLRSLTIPEQVTEIGDEAFSCSGLRSVALPESVTSLGVAVFWGCDELSGATLPAGLENIPDRMFALCENLSDIAIPDNVTKIGSQAFWECDGLIEITIPQGVKIISNSAFADCSRLRAVTFSEGLKIISPGAFCGCIRLREAVLPESVDFVGSSAFRGCDLLTKVVVLNPSCTIFGDDWDETLGSKERTVVWGYRGSTAEDFARAYGYSFEPLDADRQ